MPNEHHKRVARLQTVVDALIALDFPKDDPDTGCRRVAQLLKAQGVKAPDFMLLDSKPGIWGYQDDRGGWHWKLRRFRNNPRVPLSDGICNE